MTVMANKNLSDKRKRTGNTLRRNPYLKPEVLVSFKSSNNISTDKINCTFLSPNVNRTSNVVDVELDGNRVNTLVAYSRNKANRWETDFSIKNNLNDMHNENVGIIFTEHQFWNSKTNCKNLQENITKNGQMSTKKVRIKNINSNSETLQLLKKSGKKTVVINSIDFTQSFYIPYTDKYMIAKKNGGYTKFSINHSSTTRTKSIKLNMVDRMDDLEDFYQKHFVNEDYNEVDASSLTYAATHQSADVAIKSILNKNRLLISLPFSSFDIELLEILFQKHQVWWTKCQPFKFCISLDNNLNNVIVVEEISRNDKTITFEFAHISNSICKTNLFNLSELTTIKENGHCVFSFLSEISDFCVSDKDEYLFDKLELLGLVVDCEDLSLEECFVESDCGCCGTAVKDIWNETEFAKRFTTLTGCGHSFCNRCLVEHVVKTIDSGCKIISCPNPNRKCTNFMDFGTVISLAPGDRIQDFLWLIANNYDEIFL